MNTSKTLSVIFFLTVIICISFHTMAQTVDYGSVQIGYYKDSSVTVTNTYPVAITVNSLSLFHSPGDYSIIAGSAPVTVQPLATYTATVRFTPSSLGMITDSLVLVTSLGTVYVPLIGNGIPLPVELQSFHAVLDERGVRLDWKTAGETNNAGFEIQRSTDEMEAFNNRRFTRVGFVAGNGTTHHPHSYSFFDNDLQGRSKGPIYYRLRQIDYDGTSELSGELAVNLHRIFSADVHLRNYPNPFREGTTLRYVLSEESFVTLTIHDQLGREVARLVDAVQSPGSYAIPFRRSVLSNGSYIATMTFGARTSTLIINAD